MSSGVSDQMKVPGSTGKNLEQRNIPWSQQVDEASYENLASPAHDDNSGNNSSMQFQYPPFNAKESSNNPWNNYNKPRKSSSNFDVTKKFGKPDFYNNSRRDDYQQQQQQQQHNAWGRKPNNDNNSAYNNVSQANRYDDAYATGKLDNKSSVSGMAIEQKKQNTTPTVTAPKKTTWASIASQPVKPTSKTTLTTSSHKKKGPGLPPPPMVPGKHNLDVNTWDLPNNNPPPVPSPPPPLDLSQIDANAEPILGPGSSMFRHDLSGRPDKNIKASSIEVTRDRDRDRDENKSNYNNSNFGRVRNSPNGHSRKNWLTQSQTGQTQTGRSIIGNSGVGSGTSNYTVRRGNNDSSADGGQDRMMGNDAAAASNRFRKNERSFGAPRCDDIENTKYNYRDENTPRNYEQNLPVEEVSSESVLEELRTKNNYNPAELDLEKTKLARFFVIKSYSEDDIHRSIKYEIWCSTERGNKKLDEAFKERQNKGGKVLLFFSVNGSGHFCGMAEMITAVDYNSISNVWSQDKWKGKFKVKWIYVKDVPNNNFRHILLENNENKSVTNSRDAQEVLNGPGIQVLEILHVYRHKTSIFDDFYHYEKKQEQEVSYKRPSHYESINHAASNSPNSRHYGRQTDDRDRGGMVQKYHMNSAGTGGSISGGGSSFRERNNGMQRGNGGGGGGGGFYDYRRYDGHRNMERDNGDNNGDKEATGDKYAQKFSNNRRLDDRNHMKMNNRDKERDFSQDKQNNDGRFRAAAP